MKNLLYKEFRLVVNPLCYLTVLFGALLLIPQWVYFVAMLYLFFFIVPNVFTNAKAINDTGFTMMLPVRKRDIVKARVVSIATLELIQVVSAAFFAILNMSFYPYGNFLLDANIAYLGCVFIMFGIFNAIFFPIFYRTAYRIGWPLACALTATILFAFAVEALIIFVPEAKYVLDGISGDALMRQLPVLGAGILLFALLTALAYRKSADNFEKVDL
jgi:hypothetical protein